MPLHTLEKYEYQSGSLPAYRHYVECSCGFQSRMSNAASVKHQFDSHLVAHGVEPYFDKPITPDIAGGKEVMQEKTPTGDVLNPTLRPDEVVANEPPGPPIDPVVKETPEQQVAPDTPTSVDPNQAPQTVPPFEQTGGSIQTENNPDTSKKN